MLFIVTLAVRTVGKLTNPSIFGKVLRRFRPRSLEIQPCLTVANQVFEKNYATAYTWSYRRASLAQHPDQDRHIFSGFSIRPLRIARRRKLVVTGGPFYDTERAASSETSMNFASISIVNWHAMGEVHLDLSQRTTIITGANGSGKTSLLRLLATHAYWGAQDYRVPKAVSTNQNGHLQPHTNVEYIDIGKLEYSNGQTTRILSSLSKTVAGHIAFNHPTKTDSIFISSIRSPFTYEASNTFPISLNADLSPKNALDHARETQQRVPAGGNNGSMAAAMKRTLFTWVLGAYGVKTGDRYILEPISEYRAYYEGFQTSLRRALPEEFRFSHIEIAINGEVAFACKDGKENFIIEAGSGGFTSLLETIWLLYLADLATPDSDYTAIIDEIENHLHPSVQRKILPRLADAFPRARFIVSTHSPHVVSSVADAVVYALRYDATGRANSIQLDFREKARTAAQILDEVLGVSVTLPAWAEEELKSVIEDYAKRPISSDIFNDLRNDLRTRGLEDFAPEAISGVLKKK